MSDAEQDAVVREAAEAILQRLEAMTPAELDALSEQLQQAERAFILASLDGETTPPN